MHRWFSSPSMLAKKDQLRFDTKLLCCLALILRRLTLHLRWKITRCRLRFCRVNLCYKRVALCLCVDWQAKRLFVCVRTLKPLPDRASKSGFWLSIVSFFLLQLRTTFFHVVNVFFFLFNDRWKPNKGRGELFTMIIELFQRVSLKFFQLINDHVTESKHPSSWWWRRNFLN